MNRRQYMTCSGYVGPDRLWVKYHWGRTPPRRYQKWRVAITAVCRVWAARCRAGMPKKARPEMPPTLDHLVRTVSAAARHVGAFYAGKGIQDEATYGRSAAPGTGFLRRAPANSDTGI